MTLRRVPLDRGTVGLTRRTPLVAKKPMPRAGKRRTAMKAQARPKDTGPSPATRRVVLDRAGGCCELCGRLLHDGTTWIAAHSVHHRRPRGAGGSTAADTNTAPNLLLLCGSATTADGCHAHVEAHRAEAIAFGWLVPQGHDPSAVVVHVLHGGSLSPVLLVQDGTYEAQEAA